MNGLKDKLLLNLIEVLEKEHSELTEIASVAKATATDTDMKQEAKYDTRKIEASYLAGAQEKRVKELEIEIGLLKSLNLEVIDNNEASIGNIITLKDDKSQISYFLTPQSGGIKIELQNQVFQVISIHSPIGKELIGCHINESIEVVTPKGNKEYEVMAIN